MYTIIDGQEEKTKRKARWEVLVEIVEVPC